MNARVIVFVLAGFAAVAITACTTPDPADDGPALEGLSVSGIAPSITLMPGVTDYTLDLPLMQPSVTVTATIDAMTDSFTIAGKSAKNGIPSEPISLDLGENLVEILVEGSDGAQRVYRLTLRRAARLAQYAYGKASNATSSDFFGLSVALSGDTLAVGAPGESSAATGVNGDQGDNSASDSGAVYVFRRTGTSWQQEAYLKASNTDTGDNFGFSVALSGDTLAVGAVDEGSAATGVNGDQDDDSVPGSGAVYVFRRTGTSWQQEAYLKASNTGGDGFGGDQFGTSVALSGDNLVVGAPFESSAATGVNGDQGDDSATWSGAAYVFRRTDSSWQQEAYVKASNTTAGDSFGLSVALAGDTLAVGAHGEDSAATGIDGEDIASAADSGAVYVLRRTGASWQQEAYVKASNTGAGDGFGVSVALSGDTLAVGAFNEDSAATGVDGEQGDDSAVDSGAAYVFRRIGTSWQQEAYLKASNPGSSDFYGDQFGLSVALSGDIVAVGAVGESSAATGVDGDQYDDSAPFSGAVYVFRRTDTSWQQEAYVKASNTGADDYFGNAIALSNDTLAVGAHGEEGAASGNQDDNSGALTGALYVFH